MERKPLKIQENVRLAPLTTLNVGGPARYFVEATTEQDIPAAIEFAETIGIEAFILGGGSNILVADAGFGGLVVKIGIKGSDIRADGDTAIVTAGAGEEWDMLAAACTENDLAGFECLSGIPGLVGGTPVQNVGAYGQEVSETIESVRCFDRMSREFIEISNAECGFEYRKSIFNTTHRDRFIVLSVRFRLKKGGSPKIAYRDLIERFGAKQPTLAEVRAAVISIRRDKSMVIDRDDPNAKSAGSFFKNPIVSAERFASISREAGIAVPHFDAGAGLVKIPAAWLIEQAGFQKGFTLGHAGISSRHTLALINAGDATARDLILLKDKIRDAVLKRFGVELVPEPVFVGFDR